MASFEFLPVQGVHPRLLATGGVPGARREDRDGAMGASGQRRPRSCSRRWPWRFIRHYVDEARLHEDCTGVETIGIDETGRRGRRCITVVADPAERNVICVVPGKDSTTVKRFSDDFMARNGDPDRVRLVTCDMRPGFARGIRGRLPDAAKTIGRFHVVKHANEAVGRVRKAEARESPLLKRTKCLWSGNESDLTDPRLEVKRDLAKRRSKTAKACGMRECLQDICADSASRTEAEAGLKALRSWMMRSRPEPMRVLAGRFRRHWQDILAYFGHRCANAILGGLNGIIQHVKTHFPRLLEHGPLRHHDLPDPRQTRPQHRHRLTRFTHTKQRNAKNTIYSACCFYAH